MRNGILVALAALSMFIAAGCGDDAGESSSPPQDPRLESDGHEPLVGTTWRGDRIVGDETKVGSAGMKEPPRILLTADDRMQIFTGCNTAGGRAIADDAYIRFGPIGISRARCEGRDGRVEEALLDPLRSRVKYEFDGRRLKWIGKEFDLYLSPIGAADKVAVPARPDLLHGRAFVLNSVAGDAFTVDVPLNLSFRQEEFSADADCNSRSYRYGISDGRMTGRLAMTTEMLCGGPEGR
jgi:heat shock protein HslJ